MKNLFFDWSAFATTKLLGRIILTFFCIGAAIFTPATTYAQAPCEGANCTSKDIKVLSVELVGTNNQPLDFQAACVASTTGSVSARLKVNLKVESKTRYGFLITADVVTNIGTTAISNCYSQDFPKGEYPVFIDFTYQCGTSVQLVNVFTAWENAEPDPVLLPTYTVCSYYAGGLTSAECALITPKCKVYPEGFTVITCVTPATPTISTITQPNCVTGTGSLTITNWNTSFTYKLTGPIPTTGTPPAPVTVADNSNSLSGLSPGNYSLTASSGACTSTAATFTINPVPGAPGTPVLTITEPGICGPATGSITVTPPTANGDYSYSNDGGTTWKPDGPGENTFTGIAAGAGYNIVIRDNTTLCVSAANSCPTSVASTSSSSQAVASPSSVKAISQDAMRTEAFPNPTGRNATITFSVAKSGHALVKVYNSKGTSVATLFDGQAKAGVTNTVTLNGSALPSGIYYYKVTANGKTQSNRIAVSK